MKILALEFSSPQRSVAVANDGAAVSEVIEALPGHSMKPFAMITAALQQAGLEREQIECLVVGLGPGSYTGIRVAIAIAQGWQLARGVKLVGVSSVEAIAAQAADAATGRCSVVIDAQRGEFYLAGYELSDRQYRESTTLRIVSRAEVVQREAAGEALIGPEVTKWFPAGRLVFPRAADLARLAAAAAARSDVRSGEPLEPIYLRETTFVKAPPCRTGFQPGSI
jgi:tRNA threonylcarbamoyladenosine biosynthesis protein TsaB